MALIPAPTAGAPGGAPPTASPPGAAPPGAGGPPIGGSSATGPTQNLGVEAKQIQAGGAVLSAMAMVVALAPTSEIGKAFMDAMTKIQKMIPPGASSPQAQQNFGREMMMRQHQMAPQLAALRAGGAPGGMPGGAPGGAPPAPPSPAMAA